MQQTLGIAFIALAGALLLLAGIYSAAPWLLRQRSWPKEKPIRIREDDLIRPPGPTWPNPPSVYSVQGSAGNSAGGMVEELYAEMLSIRSSLAEIMAELWELRAKIDAGPEKPSRLRRVA
jgi:hypothetical protein